MEVLIADEFGFCFGVERAVEMVEDALEVGAPVRTLGPLIHNTQEMKRLEGEGVSTIEAPAEVGSDDIAVIRAHGVTLAAQQYTHAKNKIARLGLQDRVTIEFKDYSRLDGEFDKIASVGMFEHVGISHYDTFFKKCAELLSNNGIMLLHSIGRSEGPNVTNPWIAKYIFPGGYIPALSEVLPAIERAGLLVTDIEILRLHYAETLKAWRERFLAHRDDVERIYEPRFARMWEFYLAASEMSFREQNMMVMQIQLTKRQGVVPITRNYIASEERRLASAENRRRPPLRLAGE